MKKKPHKTLEAWKQAIELTVRIYRLTEKLPKAEQFGLTGQMRRAAVSVASNIAEGAARNTKKEFMRFLHTAQASLAELDTQVFICMKLEYFSDEEVLQLDEEMEREIKLITGLIKFLKKPVQR
jgi:four helix bundle protein